MSLLLPPILPYHPPCYYFVVLKANCLTSYSCSIRLIANRETGPCAWEHNEGSDSGEGAAGVNSGQFQAAFSRECAVVQQGVYCVFMLLNKHG